MPDLSQDESYFVEAEDVFPDVTAPISSCKSAKRDEYGKSNLAAEEHFENSLELHDERVREVLRCWNDVESRCSRPPLLRSWCLWTWSFSMTSRTPK